MTTIVPTSREAAYLANLGSVYTPPSQSPVTIRHELREILRLFRIPWITDFLFNIEMNSLSALTSPINMRNAVASNVQMTNIQCDSESTHRPFDINMNGSFIFVPSFSVGHLSVGFGIQECISNCFFDWWEFSGSPKMCTSHFRYVRDDKNGMMIMLQHDDHSNTIKVDAMSHLTTKMRRRVFAVFDGQLMQNAVHSNIGPLPIDAVVAALKFINFLSETRNCPYCGTRPDSSCSCNLDLTSPAHPLDFSPLRKNMSTYLGAYEGLARTAVVCDGIELLGSTVGSRITITGDLDDELMSRLTRWAISDQLEGKKENPLPMIMPVEGVAPETDASMPDRAEMAGSNMLVNNQDYEPLQIAANFLEEDLNASSCSSRSAALEEDLTKVISSVLPMEKLEETNALHDVNMETSILENAEDEIGGGVDTWTTLTDEALVLVESITGGKDVSKICRVESAEDKVSDSFSIVDHTDSNNTKKSVPSDGKLHASKKTLIAPATAIQTTMTQEVDERELRAQLRKQRNREAAQRSNARRKLKNDSLKQALKEVHEKAAQLRAQELSLREENLRLRKLTSS